LADSGKCRVLETLDALKRSTPSDNAKVHASLQYVADHGLSGLPIPKKQRPLRNHTVELKPTPKLRIIGFWANANIFVAHSVLSKGTEKEQTGHIDQAVEYKKSLGEAGFSVVA